MLRHTIIAMIGLLLAAASPPPPQAITWLPAPIVYPPRLTVQFGHISPVDAAAWLDRGHILVTADAADMTVIIWNADTGEISDRIAMPLLGRDGLVNGVSVRSLAINQAEGSATLAIMAYGLPRADGRVQGELYNLTLDLKRHSFAAVAAPKIIPIAEVDRAIRAAVPLPADRDDWGRPIRLSRQGNAIDVERAEGTPPPAPTSAATLVASPAISVMRLGGVPKGYFTDAAMSPDGFRLARITRASSTGGETTVWDSRSSYTVPGFPTDAGYDKVGWIGRDRYYAGNADGSVAAIVADAASGRILGTVPPRCQMTPVGDDGLFVAAGPGSCGVAPSAADGLWFFERDDPAGTGFSLARHWQRRPLPAAAAREIVTALAVGPSEQKIPGKWEIYAATRPRLPVKGVYPASWLHVGSDPAQPAEFLDFFKAADQQGLMREQMFARRLAVSRSGDIGLWAFSGDVRLITEDGPVTGLALETMIDRTSLLDSDDSAVAVGSVADQALQRFDAKTGKRLASLPVSGVLTGGYLSPLPLLWAASNDGALRFWDTRSPEARAGQPANWSPDPTAPLLQIFSFPGNHFFAALPDGRYDTNLGPDTENVRWVMPHRPFEPLPAQTFMRSRYEPDLLRRLLACVEARDCTREFPPLADVRSLNRAVPVTRITSVTPMPGAHAVTVTVETREGIERVDGPIGATAFHKSGAHDLRLFVDGRLVRQFPDVVITKATAADDAAWRTATALPKVRNPDRDCGNCFDVPATQTFTVPIASARQPISLSAYAFNEDRIKGPTWQYRYDPPPPDPASDLPARRQRAVVVAIGIDTTANPDWRLNYAANDAVAMVAALKSLPDREVVPILLTSTEAADNATKPKISAVLRQLNGFATDADRKLLQAMAIDPAGLPPLTPDDIVILAFSGHGDTIDGQFYMLPSDAVALPDGRPDTATLMSSLELTTWARRVEAGDMAMIIDACHSAASVDAGGFKPGPMGDPGLGQLAYDKRIHILAATQADNVALEDGKFGHGLLTYALVNDGLVAGLAEDRDGDGRLSLDEWLHYGVARVPALAAEVTAGKHSLMAASIAGARGITANRTAPPKTAAIQRPSLFDFGDERDSVFIRAKLSTP